MQNWVMLNMLRLLQATLFFLFHRHCLCTGMYEKKPNLAGLNVLT